MENKEDIEKVEIGHLSKKSLKKLAKHYKIKNYKQKSPASLRRALKRFKKRTAPKSKQKSASFEAAVDAYREQRLRYLFSPSKFVHAGVHEEFILEKDEDLEFEDWYRTDEMVVMPIDPYQFYTYWDFSDKTTEIIEELFPRYPFILRVYDITDLVFNGGNAHGKWDQVCHPLIKEMYLNNLPVAGRNICIELGYVQAKTFQPILRSNSIAIPPESVSPIIDDVFGQYNPPQTQFYLSQSLPDRSQTQTSLSETNVALPSPHQFSELFFQPFVIPTKMEQPDWINQTSIHWQPKVREVEDTIQADLVPRLPAPRPQPTTIKPFHPMQHQPVFQEREDLPVSEEYHWLPSELTVSPQEYFQHLPFTVHGQLPEYEEFWTWVSPEWFDQGGIVWQVQGQWPEYISPYFFFEEFDSPHDEVTVVSLGLWPWEWEEYIPLGSSDWTIRKFLGASPSSWVFKKPGGSERRWKLKPTGGSEKRWKLKPAGGSEKRWRLKPPGASERRWQIKPSGASERRLKSKPAGGSERRLINWSGRG